MGVYFDDNKLVIIAEPRSICFNLINKIDNSIKHEPNYVINDNGYLAEQKIKSKIDHFLYKYKHGSYIYDHRKE